MKRIIAIILTIATLSGCVFSLSGCSSGNQSLTMGQWLTMINDSFGMASYAQEKPYFSNVTSKNSYFEAVQIAAEWDVISKDEELDVDKSVTWQEALITLVNAGNFTGVDSSVDEKVECAISKFDDSIRKYWMNREIKYENAIVLLAKAQSLWATKTYETRTEEVSFKEEVKDFSANEQVAEEYEIQDNVTVLPDDGSVEISDGDVYILPSSEKSIGTKAFKAKSVKKHNGKIYITNDAEELDLYDIAENIYLTETVVPSAENTVIYDGNGNQISQSIEVTPQNNTRYGVEPTNLVNTGADALIKNIANVTHSFNTAGYSVSLSYNLDGALDLSATVKKDNQKITAGFSNLTVTNEIDYSWFKLKSASVRVDYDTKVSYEIGKKKTVVNKIAAPYNNGNGKGFTNLKKGLKNIKDADSKGAKTIKLGSIDVWSIGVARVCLDLNFKIEIDGSFSITLTTSDSKGVEYKNNNVRFINSSEKDIDIQAKAKIEATLGVGPALYTVGLKKPILGVEARIGAGAEASITLHLADMENHLIGECTASDYPPEYYEAFIGANITTDEATIIAAAEAQGGVYKGSFSGAINLKPMVCIDVSMYWILTLGVTDSSYAADLLGGKISLKHQFFGKKNGKFAYAHIENFDFVSGFSNIKFGSAANVDLCTMEFTPFDDVEETTATENKGNEKTDTIVKGDRIVLGEMRGGISIGQKYYIVVQQIPKGYSLNDLVYKVDDPKIASIDNNGAIIGKESGSTLIIVSTSDGKYSGYCALTVVDPTVKKFDGLKINRISPGVFA